jgi:potassium-transporting ATPase KdpC subunit
MLRTLRPAILVSLIFLVLLGLAYPLAETGVGQAFFSRQASGSLTSNGSTLVGQTWASPRWFQGRPDSDDPMATGAANLGPRSEVLVQDVRKQIGLLRKAGITPAPDLVTTSGSGVDPDISPADAYAQISAVARARSLPAAAVRRLVAEHIAAPQFGFLGSAYVNVLQLNEALARMR